MKHITTALVVAASAVAIAQPAIVSAAPKPFDGAGFDACSGQAYKDWRADKISDQTYKELVQGCCYFAGGKWVVDPAYSAGGYCQPPPKFGIEGAPLHDLEQVAPQRPNIADGGAITATLTP
jgi:hypothetical protein